MASRIATRALLRSSIPQRQLSSPCRTFATTSRMMDTAGALPARRPVGAFRGGLFGFLLGAVTAGAGMYYYVLDEYKVSNELLTEDIYALQAAVQRTESYVRTVEDKMDTLAKRK